MVLDAAAGRMPAYVDTGLNVVHVDDVAAGHLLAYHGRPGERYILGGQDMTLREILVEIAGIVWTQAAHDPVANGRRVAHRVRGRGLRPGDRATRPYHG